MNEWTVVTVLVTLAGFIIAIVSPLVKLNNTITRINTTVTALEKDLETLTRNSTQGHTQMLESNREQDRQITEMQIRLAVIERGRK